MVQRRRRRHRTAARAPWFDSPWQIAGRALGSALAIVAVAVLLALVVVPRLLGGDSLTVLSGSMEPTFAPGDVAVVRGIDEGKVCTELSIGDIVTFFPEPNDPTLITHRVVGKTIGTYPDGTNCRIVTQGDANPTADEPISPAQIRGVFMYGIPKLGWARQWVGDNRVVALGALVAGLVGWGLFSMFRKPKTTVVRVPRAEGVGESGRSAAAPASTADRALRERELSIRERELELRERELAFAIERAESGEPAAALAEGQPASGDAIHNLSPEPRRERSDHGSDASTIAS